MISFHKLILAFPVAFLCGFSHSAIGQTPQGKGSVRIAWDFGSVQQLADKGGYPRLLRLQDGTLIVVYENYEGDIHYKTSRDNGDSWSAPHTLFAKFTAGSSGHLSTEVNMANPEITQLPSGKILVACNFRPRKPGIYPFSIAAKELRLSGPPDTAHILYRAGTEFKDGCWEPAFLQLPGELQLYFANESPYRSSDEQEISMLSSFDEGNSWSQTARTVSFRPGKRDGMPVPVQLNQEIVVAIEDNKSAQFKPYTVRTSVQEKWAQPVKGNSPQRDYALLEQIPDSFYLGAPYLIKLPNEQTLLSYQTTQGRTANWELSTLEVAIGDHRARGFTRRTRPFDLPLEKQAKWNSLAVWDSSTVVALSSTDLAGTTVAPLLIQGYLIDDTIQTSNTSKEMPVFIGGKSRNTLRAGFSDKGDSVLVSCVLSGEASTLTLYTTRNEKARKLRVSTEGEVQAFERKSGDWKPAISLEKANIDLTPTGYRLVLAVPKPDGASAMQMGLSFDYPGNDGVIQTETLVHLDENDPQTWLNVCFSIRGSKEEMRRKSD